MNYLNVSFDYKNKVSLDPQFIPFGLWASAFLEEAKRPFRVAVWRENGNISVFQSFLRDESFAEANYRYMERTVKFLLWSVGGWRVSICGCEETAERVRRAYAADAERAFDLGFMNDVYERPLEIVLCGEKDFPEPKEQPRPTACWRRNIQRSRSA